MNRIAIVGHPASGYAEVLELLQRSGMALARPSRREGLLPQDINIALMKAHNAPPLSAVLEEDGFTPIEASPVWHGMALDLMLGNLDEPLWGWADPQAIYALGYWAELDPELTFVLVYDEPHRALIEAARSQDGSPAAEELHRVVDNWTAYNGALLRFHLRHAGRSVLVHAQQARRAATAYLQQLQPLLDTPLSLPELNADTNLDAVTSAFPVAPIPPAILTQAVAAAGAEPKKAVALLAAGAAERYLVDGVLARHRRALQLYAELQSVANLPLDREAVAAESAAAAWEALVTQRAFVGKLLAQIHAKYEDASEELSRTRTRLDEATEWRKDRENASREYEEKLEELSAENEMLLTQLHDVQEELEKVFLRKVELESNQAKAAARRKVAAKRSEQRIKDLVRRLKDARRRLSETSEEARRINEHIAYRVGQAVLTHGRTPWGWVILPFALIRVAYDYRKRRQGAFG